MRLRISLTCRPRCCAAGAHMRRHCTDCRAAEPNWPDRSLSLRAQDQPLADFLRELFSSAGMSAQPSNGRRGRISGPFDDRPEKIFADVVKAYDLLPYYDGAVMHVAHRARCRANPSARRPAISSASHARWQQQARRSYQSMQLSRDDGLIKLRGTPEFVSDMEH